MKPVLVPYLNFAGKTAEAMKFYQAVLGGELKMNTFAESGMPSKEEEKDFIIHAELKTNFCVIMSSDGDSTHPVTMGNNVQLSINGTDEGLITKYFNGLAEGGSVDLKLEKQFWGDIYGQLTDKFGVHWMVNISQAQK